MVCTTFLTKRLQFQIIKKIPINPSINYCIVFNWYCQEGSNETRVAITGKNVFYSIHHQLLALINVTFVPEIICEIGEKVFVFLWAWCCEQTSANTLPTLKSIDEHHVFRLKFKLKKSKKAFYDSNFIKKNPKR